MKTFKFLTPAAITLLAGGMLQSCSDDDGPKGPANAGEPTTENVFAQGLPSSVDGATFTTNEKGQLTKIADGATNITFEYGTFSPARSRNFTVLMKERDAYYPEEGSDIYMEINKQGFVSYAYQVYLNPEEDEADEWWFEYNNDGQLTRLRRSEGGDDFKITYSNGDITKVTQIDEDGDRTECVINYTNSEYRNPVANKGCIMLFDDFFQVDMDEMGIVYFAGLLGKATKNLPMGYTDYEEEETYHWVFNADNLPTEFGLGGGVVRFSW